MFYKLLPNSHNVYFALLAIILPQATKFGRKLIMWILKRESWRIHFFR